MGLKEELFAAKNSTALFHPADSGHFTIEGADAASYLQRIVTNDVASLTISEGQHNALLDRKGMVLSLFYLLRTGENSFHTIIPSSLIKKTEGILKKTIFLSEVVLKDVTGDWGVLRVIGKSPPIPLFFKEGERGGDFSWHDNFYTVPVWNLLAPKSQIDPLKKQLALPEISKTAFDIIRMESGIPEYGVDIDETHLLLEANLSHTYKRQKGCYPGQEVVERILAYGQGRTPKKLSPLYIKGEHEIAPKTAIYSSSTEKVGEITSALFNPLEEKTVVLAYLDFKYASEAKELHVKKEKLILRDGDTYP